ncbi:VOC family protein [Noviherbaspirillum aerium]|uniref:hypothetical protein n=1 Tax=Noviherbaspirillum aerium TaxID=2588497 RepID=UPI00124F0511|nr:hypothetical protein [Noviherbaspirillum aerium]
MIDYTGTAVNDFIRSKYFFVQALAPLAYAIACRVSSRKIVDLFHEAALAAGGIDNGVPGLRPHHHPDYYGAFVLDPEGRNIEAACRQPA